MVKQSLVLNPFKQNISSWKVTYVYHLFGSLCYCLMYFCGAASDHGHWRDGLKKGVPRTCSRTWHMCVYAYAMYFYRDALYCNGYMVAWDACLTARDTCTRAWHICACLFSCVGEGDGWSQMDGQLDTHVRMKHQTIYMRSLLGWLGLGWLNIP